MSEPAYHDGVLYGIRHPGPSQVGCPYCAATLDQKAMIDRWRTPTPEVEAREVARQRLAALNVDGWRAESDHGCDGTEEGCAATCPIQVQVRVSPDEIIDAILDAFAHDERIRADERERLAGEVEAG